MSTQKEVPDDLELTKPQRQSYITELSRLMGPTTCLGAFNGDADLVRTVQRERARAQRERSRAPRQRQVDDDEIGG